MTFVDEPQAGTSGTWDATASEDGDLLLSLSDAGGALASGEPTEEEDNPYTEEDASAHG
jgi:hypothetical protein